MKKVLIGGFLSLIGAIWLLAILLFAGSNLVSGWSTPPGRFLTTVAETGMAGPMALGAALMALGLLILAIEYLRRD